jgi:hypothetical protein
MQKINSPIGNIGTMPSTLSHSIANPEPKLITVMNSLAAAVSA